MSNDFFNGSSPSWDRRKFVAAFIRTSFVAPFLTLPTNSATIPETGIISVQQVIDLILKSIPGAPFKNTVDTIKAGEGSQPVKGIVTTMFATLDVITKSIDTGANFIIAHEPTFYNHTDDVSWLINNDVYQYKKELLQKNGIAVWRFHDYWHAHRPDGILQGVLESLGWDKMTDSANPSLVNMEGMTIKQIGDHLKTRLGIEKLKVMGDANDVCRKIVVMPGAAGGRSQIDRIMQLHPDLLIVGELNEWETAEFVRDARSKSDKVCLIVLGHAVSEEPGMQYLVNWLQPQLPASIKVSHIPSGEPFRFV